MTAYGEPEKIPTPEIGACVPVSYYGVTKYAAERYAHVAGARDDVDLAVTSLRMFNVYGPRQSIDNPYQGVLAIFIGNVLRGEPITIHGDGAQTRDFVFVDDVVDAWMRVLDDPATRGAVLNVGSGRETSVNELADAVLAALRRVARHVGDRPAGRRSSATSGVLRPTRRARGAGWHPSVRSRTESRRTVAWARAVLIRLAWPPGAVFLIAATERAPPPERTHPRSELGAAATAGREAARVARDGHARVARLRRKRTRCRTASHRRRPLARMRSRPSGWPGSAARAPSSRRRDRGAPESSDWRRPAHRGCDRARRGTASG